MSTNLTQVLNWCGYVREIFLSVSESGWKELLEAFVCDDKTLSMVIEGRPPLCFRCREVGAHQKILWNGRSSEWRGSWSAGVNTGERKRWRGERERSEKGRRRGKLVSSVFIWPYLDHNKNLWHEKRLSCTINTNKISSNKSGKKSGVKKRNLSKVHSGWKNSKSLYVSFKLYNIAGENLAIVIQNYSDGNSICKNIDCRILLQKSNILSTLSQ